jgi:DmsE family decaheme c-type cytochrome
MNTRYFKLHLMVITAILLQWGVTGAAIAADKGIIDWAALNPDVKGATFVNSDKKCVECHEKYTRKFATTKMGMALPDGGCESCHGPMSKHLDAPRQKPSLVVALSDKKTEFVPNPLNSEQRAAICTQCHTGGLQLYWQMSTHAVVGNTCTNCHDIMAVQDPVRLRTEQANVCFTCHKDQKTDTRKISHHPIREGKVICSDCHNPHGSMTRVNLKKNTVNETCYQCHAEKRGPLLFEHEPVAEDCTNCHTPHGSNITPLLKTRPPFLCQECHDGPHQSDGPPGRRVAGWQGGLTGSASETFGGRACLNCHTQIHGSNNPAGAILQR